MAVAERWGLYRLRAGNGSLGRRDNDLHDLTKSFRQKITGRRSTIGAIGDKARTPEDAVAIIVTLTAERKTAAIVPSSI